MYYIMTQHDRNFRRSGNCRNTSYKASVFYISQVLSNGIMCTIDNRDRVPIDTGDRHLGRPVIDISVDPRLTHGRHLGRQTFNFR